MPYPKDHKQRTRQAILESARRLFAQKGFEAASIERIMGACGLTRGAFYAHFASKGELYREAIGGAATLAGDILGDSALAFLAIDAASKDPEVRAAYTHALKAIGDTTLATTAMAVGALAIAMTVDDEALKASVLDACREGARDLRHRDAPAFLWSVAA